jgi:hypothetical protein
MIQQLVLSKRFFVTGAEYVDRPDPISAGMAISMFQDAVEIFIWTLLKDLDAKVNENDPFTKYFDLVEKAPKNEKQKQLPFKAKILELNKARVNFKHYGNLPDVSESKKFCDYTEEFLRSSFDIFFNISFDELSLIDIISFEDVRTYLKAADNALANDKVKDSYGEIAKARNVLLRKVSIFIPEVDRNLADADRLLADFSRRNVRIFRYIIDYLDKMRDLSIASLCNIPLKKYLAFSKQLPNVSQTQAGNWHVSYKYTTGYKKDTAREMIIFLADVSVKIQSIIS